MTNSFSVKNSIDFIDRIKDVVIEEDDILVSFDVVSRFTSVPVDCAIKCIFDLLVVDDSLPTRTQLNAHDVKTGLEICSNSAAFFLFKTFCIDKRLVLPWDHASLPLWLTSSWSI